MTSFPVDKLRAQYPSLNRRVAGMLPIYLDGPGGTQVPKRVIDAMVHYLSTCNANHGGAFTTSKESARILDDTHQAMADFLNAPSSEEIVFGQNMTSLTFQISRSLSRTWKPRDQLLVTRLDHDANVRPWVLAARDAGATVQFVEVNPRDCTIDIEDLQSKLSPHTKLLAITAASNVVGTMNDVLSLTKRAHELGALVFVDAVHYAPHGPIDVQAWDCDFLACSAFKFFGPHVGVLWGRRKLMEALEAYKVAPAPRTLPGKWMTGTQNHEGLAGVAAAVGYLADIGEGLDRRLAVRRAMTAIRDYERELATKLLKGLAERKQFRVWGITDMGRLVQRVPTISFTTP